MEWFGDFTFRLEYSLNSKCSQHYAVLQSEPAHFRLESDGLRSFGAGFEEEMVFLREVSGWHKSHGHWTRYRISTMIPRWKLVFPLRDYLSWHFGPGILICVLPSHITASIKLILRSMVVPKELLKRMEMDDGYHTWEELIRTSYTIGPMPSGISPPGISNKSLTTYGWQQSTQAGAMSGIQPYAITFLAGSE